MPLVDESEEDRKLATLIKYKSVESYDERQARKRKAIEEASVGRVSQSRPSLPYVITGSLTLNAFLNLRNSGFSFDGIVRRGSVSLEKAQSLLRCTESRGTSAFCQVHVGFWHGRP